MSDAKDRPPKQDPQILVVLLTVFVTYIGQNSLSPVIAPIARETGLAEWQMGMTVSGSALMVVLLSRRWGRTSQSWGRKRTLITALTLGTVAMALFALSAILGMQQDPVLTGTPLFVAMVATRGLAYGVAISAVMPTAQAFIADVIPPGKRRVDTMAKLGGMQALSMVTGAVVGGMLSSIDLAVPLVLVPVVLAIALTLVATRLKPTAPQDLIAAPVQLPFTDPRVLPFLLCGFGLWTSMGFIQVILGFIIQDRFHLDSKTTALVTGGALLLSGLGMIISQMVLVPRTGWTPSQLLRRGASLVLIGFLVIIPDVPFALLAAGVLTIGLGMGLAAPGYQTGPTLMVDREEQGGVAGLIGSTNGLTFVIAPTAGAALYGIDGRLPLVAAAVLMAAVLTLASTHPVLKSTHFGGTGLDLDDL